MACQSSCCGPAKAPAIDDQSAVPPENAPISINGTDDCCNTAKIQDAEARQEEQKDHEAVKTGCGDTCCDEEKINSDGCCSKGRQSEDGMKTENTDLCEDACCEGEYRTEELITNSSCQGSCCGDNSQAFPNIQGTLPRLTNIADNKPASTQSCKKNCCSEETKTRISSDNTSDSCCNKKSARSAVELGCGKNEGESSQDEDCKKDCCSSTILSVIEDADTPSCCKGKPSPCCDESCLDRVALRSCENGDDSSSECKKRTEGKPCNQHKSAARDTYAFKLEALGCICWALLAVGQQSCCVPMKRKAAEKKGCSRNRSIESPRSSVSADSCCTTSRTSEAVLKQRPRSKNGCCPPRSGSVVAIDDCCAIDPIEPMEETSGPFIQISDIEKRGSGKEHIILSVSGMTCTGCETKLRRTFIPLTSVSNLKTSLILSRAEFDLDLGTQSPDEVIKHLQRTTEFKVERIMDQGATIDIIPNVDLATFIEQPWPEGVIEMLEVDKIKIRVSFDPKIIGARDLIHKGWSTPVKLAAPRADPALEAGSKHVRNLLYMTLLSIALTIPVLVLAWAPIPKREITYGSVSLALATLVQFGIAGPFYPNALKALIFSGVIEMDLLIVLSTTAAYIFSCVSFAYLVSGRPLSTREFFETSTLLVTLIMVGRYVAALARQKAVESISIRSLQSSTAIVVDQKDGTELVIDVRLLQYGDIFKVVPDSRIATDGTVISGISEVDESMITGESRLVEKRAKSGVVAGSINTAGTLVVHLTRLPSENTISTIAGLVDQAKLSKPKIQDIADRVASWFVPVIVVLTIITFITWVGIGVSIQKRSGSEATINAITYAITVLIISCPCAIGLAVPMVIVIASGVGAERGVIFKSAHSIEVAHKTDHVVFDKTGTLTEGTLAVMEAKYFGTDLKIDASLLLGLLSGFKHPVSVAVHAYLTENGISVSPIQDIKSLPGKGVEGTTPSGSTVRAGNSRWLNLSSNPDIQSSLSKGYTTFCFTINGNLSAVFSLQDSIRSDATSVIEVLRKRGIEIHLLSGDDDGPVQTVGRDLNILPSNTRSRCTPAEKQAYIQSLLDIPITKLRAFNLVNSTTKPTVIFIGDGTNDAPALALSTIGIHIPPSNENTLSFSISQSASDIVFLSSRLSNLTTLLRVSDNTIGRIKFNFFWSFIYNLFAILIGAGVLDAVGVRIPPQYAGLGELVSVLPVVGAAVALRWERI